MQIHFGFEQWKFAGRTVASLGNYDGVHIGHQAIVKRVAEQARSLSDASVIVTFDPIPKKVLYPESAPRLIQTLDQRLHSIASHGIEHAIVVHFDVEFAKKGPEEFVREYLFSALHISELIVGNNFSFGHQKRGNIELLKQMGADYDFRVQAIGEIKMDGTRVSSTAIRKMILDGNIEDANKYLGRPFSLIGTVVEGERLGGKLGIPTANLSVENEILPARGVYVTRAKVGATAYPSVTNVGIRPTVGGSKLTVESHLLRFSGDLYGQKLELDLLFRLRDEMRFPNIEELKMKIRSDIERAEQYFQPEGPTKL